MASTTYDIKINSTQAEQALNRLQTNVSAATRAFDGLKNAFAGIAIGALINNVIKFADAIKDVSAATGIAVENVTGFSRAVENAGGNGASAGESLLRLVGNIEEAADGSKGLQDAFSKVGVSLSDLASLSEQEILGKVITGLKNVSNASEQVALKTQLLGKNFRSVDVGQLASGYDAAVESSRRYASAIEAAAAAQGNLDLAISQLQMSLLKVIEPITSFIGALDVETIESTVDLVVKLGSVLVPLLIFERLVAIAIAFAGSIGAVGGAIATVLGTLVSFLTPLGLILRGLLLLGTLVGGIGVAFPEFAKGVKDFFSGATDSVKEFLGISKQVESSADVLKRLNVTPSDAGAGRGNSQASVTAQIERGKALAVEVDQRRKVTDAIEKEAAAIRRSVDGYKESIKANQERYALETSLIGKTQQAKDAEQQRFDAKIKYEQELGKLQEQINARAGSDNDSDIRMTKELESAKGQLTKAYQAQLGSINGLTASREKANQAQNLALFQTQALSDASRQLADIQLEIAKVGLPEIEKKYKDIEAASRQAAQAAIEEEEARRGVKLDPTERQKYYDASVKGTDKLREATEKLTQAQNQLNLANFAKKETLDLEREIRKVQDDIATSTMPAMAKKAYEIKRAAEERALAEIAAEETRRGSLMTDDEKKKYMDASLKGSDELIRKNRELYDQSRSFESGWKRAYNEYMDDATNAAKTAESLFKKTTQGMEDLIVGFVKTGKFEWKSFVGGIAEELLRANLKQVIGSVFGDSEGGLGGMLGGLADIFGFSTGSKAQGGAGGASKGASQNNPLYVYDVTNAGPGGGNNPLSKLLGGGGINPNDPYGYGQGKDPLGDLISGKGFGGGSDDMFSGVKDIFGGGSGGGGGFFETAGNAIKDIFGGWFANGGTLAPGKFGIVGERGPEFIGGPANITPMAGNVTYNINAVDAQSFKQMIAADPSFIHGVAMAGARTAPSRR